MAPISRVVYALYGGSFGLGQWKPWSVEHSKGTHSLELMDHPNRVD